MVMLEKLVSFYIERKDFIMPLMIEHLQISVIAILFATIVGVSLGVFIAEKKKISFFVLGVTSFLYTIPAISMLGFLIPLSGIGNTSAILALSLYALLPIIRNTYTGITSVDKDILEAAKGMGSTNRQILFRIKLPLAFPMIMSGFRNMVVMTIALAGIASFIGAGGLGVAIYRGITTNNQTMTIAGSLAVAILALFSDLIIGGYAKYIRNRKSSKKKKLMVSCALFLCTAVVAVSIMTPPTKGDTIHIATKPMTEEFIVGEMLRQLIEANTDLYVKMTKGVGGGTSNIHPAMVSKKFDLYPEYTGTSWNFVLKKTSTPDHTMLYKDLVKEYQEKYDMSWLGLYGFNNTYGIVVRKDTAKTYNVKTYSDLAKISSNLIFGGEYDFFERDDGFDPLSKEYNFKFKKTIDLDIGLKYNALLKKEVDATVVFTTDGRLSDPNIVVLEDDRRFFKSYFAGTIIRNEVLKKHPELQDILMKLTNEISDKEMSEMNYEVEEKGKNEAAVAKEFLIKKKLLEVDYE